MSSSWAAAPGDSSWRRGSLHAACGRSSVKSTHASAIRCIAPACFRPTASRNSICRDSATLNQLTSVRFLSPGGIPVDYTTPAPLATVIDRPVFDRALADRAIAAGAEIRVGARVTALEVDRAGVRAMVGDAVVQARLAVLACGATYKFQRRFGFGLPTTYLQTAQRELPGPLPQGRRAALRTGRRARRVRLGGAGAAARGRVRADWRDGVARHPPLLRAHARTPPRSVGRDRRRCRAAREDPAARRGRPHLRRSDAGDRRRRGSREADHRRRHSLQHRQRGAGRRRRRSRRWRPIGSTRRPCRRTSPRGARELADEFEAQQELREIAASLSDEAIDSFFELAHTDGIMPIVRATARFNEHRPLIRALFKHPPARRILFRAMIA